MGLRRWLESKGLRAHNCYHSSYNISYYNWRTPYSGYLNADKEWFTLFLKDLHLSKKINIYSLFGYRAYLERRLSKVKSDQINIFYTQENVSKETIIPRHRQYRDYLIGFVDFSLGFDYIEDERYLRFPYWFLGFVPPDASFESITSVINSINSFDGNVDDKIYDCSLISRHDHTGYREKVVRLLEPLMDIRFEGEWNNNSSDLWKKFSNDKIKYLNYCRFNIAFENSNSYGYVTEKIFDAFRGQAIPIYWGGDHVVEPSIIEEGSFLYFDERNPDNLYNEVDYLLRNKKAYKEFLGQRKIKLTAAEKIYEIMQSFKEKMRELDIS